MTTTSVRLAACEVCGATGCCARALCRRCYAVTWARQQTIPDDVDEVAVLRAVRGDHLRLRRGERIEVVRVLTTQGLSARQIAARLNVFVRVIQRDRQGLRANGLLPPIEVAS